MSTHATKIGDISAKPLPGFAFVQMRGIYDEKSGLIHIPERMRTKRHGFGKLVSANSTPENDRAIGRSYSSLENTSIIFADYAKAPVHGDLYRIPIDSIIAIVTDENIKIEAVGAFNGVDRCQWCGPAKPGSPNSMLCDESGYCYRCGKNAQGEKRDEFSERALSPFTR